MAGMVSTNNGLIRVTPEDRQLVFFLNDVKNFHIDGIVLEICFLGK